MLNFMSDFRSLPGSLKISIIFLYIGWVWFFVTLYNILGELPARVFIAGVSACILAITVYKWGRILCLMCNTIVVLLSLCFAVYFWNVDFMKVIVFGLNIGLFSITTYYLAIKESSEFFQ